MQCPVYHEQAERARHMSQAAIIARLKVLRVKMEEALLMRRPFDDEADEYAALADELDLRRW